MYWIVATEEGPKIGDFRLAAEVAEIIEIVAIIAITVGVASALIVGAVRWIQEDGHAATIAFKRVIARGMLVGLDLLIAADVIKTVTLDGTLESALVLGLLVLIRTFLSWSMVLEVSGKWPWQLEAGELDQAET